MASYEKLWDMPITGSFDEKSDQPHKRISHVLGNIIYVVIACAFKIAFRYHVDGRENIRAFQNKGAVIVGNHTSYLDPVMMWIGARPQQWIRFMARDNMFKNFHGLAGHALARVGAVPVKRDTADRGAIKRATAILKRGELVGIYPEGTRRGRGTADPALHAGVAFIARMGKAPMIPSTVRNIENVKPAGQKFIRFPKVTVEFGKPVYLEDFDFLPKAERLDGAAWYVMRECYALSRQVPREQVDMTELFPEAQDFTEVFSGKDLSRSEH